MIEYVHRSTLNISDLKAAHIKERIHLGYITSSKMTNHLHSEYITIHNSRVSKAVKSNIAGNLILAHDPYWTTKKNIS